MPYKQRLNSWIIVRLLPNLQRSVVVGFAVGRMQTDKFWGQVSSDTGFLFLDG